MIKTIIPALIGLIALPLTVSATGLSVSPTRLDFEVVDGGKASQTLTVINPTADVMVFEVYPDEFEDAIKANPESFTLESGGRKEVSISVDVSSPLFLKEGVGGVKSTNLSVVGKPLAESKVNVGAGAKIPVTINMALAKNSPVNKLMLIVISSAAVLAAAFYLGRKTQTSQQ